MNFSDALQQLSQDELTAVSLPIFFIAIILEAMISRSKNLQLYRFQDFCISIAMLVVSALVDFLPKLIAFVAFL